MLLGLVAGPMDDIERLRALLDYHTAIGALAVLCIAVATLFLLLMRAKDAHLNTALRLAPLTERMTATVEANTRVIERLAEELHDGRREKRDAGAA